MHSKTSAAWAMFKKGACEINVLITKAPRQMLSSAFQLGVDLSPTDNNGVQPGMT
jgi:hypothetical protein